ncbi:hypothetical protein [Pseudonocardia sp.]|uniref:hypothetical protein n=1 Tax=Pseudonocardia sp. TaxID=60912 RepID=UPI002616E392|nr:hypothetical protein [Pseudonocardia sp.]
MTELAPRTPSRLTGVAALALLTFDGALLGAFGLAFTPMYAGGFPVPMGVVFTVLILPWLVLRAGEIDPRPAAAAAPLIAWFLVVAVLAVAGPGGDVMLPVTWQSGLLFLGGVGAGLWALRQVVDQ